MSRFHHNPLTRRPSAWATLLTAGTLAAAIAAPASAQTLVKLGGHVPDLVAKSAPRGTLSSATSLWFNVNLPIRDQAGLNDFIHGLYDPADARFHHYITPEEFGTRFGPTTEQYAAVLSYLRSQGLNIMQTNPGRTTVSATGTAAQINKAFGVTLKQFQSPDGRIFHAPDTDVSVPKGLLVSGVVGLDDAELARPLARKMRTIPAPEAAAFDAKPRAVQNPPVAQGTGVGGGYSPSDLQTVYGLKGTTLNGAGQTLAVCEFSTDYNPKDVIRFTSQYGLRRIPVSPISVDGFATTGTYTSAATEAILDIDAQIALAPGAAQILVFEAPNGTSHYVNALAAVLADGRAKQVSISYGAGAESSSSTSPSQNQAAIYTELLQLVSAGISVYVSSGDSGDSAGSNAVQVDYFGSEPDLCCVGGTYLLVKNPGVDETYKSESTWNYDLGPDSTAIGDGAGGGGVSHQWTIAANSYAIAKSGSKPAYTLTYGGASYQVNAATFAAQNSTSHVSATYRNIPDISAEGSPQTGFSIYSGADPTLQPGWYIFGGTSLSAPLWAAFNALVNQNLVRQGKSVLGFPNPALYSLAYTSNGLTNSYSSIFHDINDGSSNSTVTVSPVTYTAVTGFDDSTGLGSFNGVNLIQALSGSTP